MEWVNALGSTVLLIVAGGIGWLVKSKDETRKLEREAIREQRFSAYFDAIEPLIGILIRTKKPNEKPTITESINVPDYRRKAFHLLLFADDNVVRAWNKLWYELYHNPPTPINNIIHIDNIGELLVQIRKSLGYPKTQVDKRDMFTWLIKDIEKMDKLVKLAKKAQNLQSN